MCVGLVSSNKADAYLTFGAHLSQWDTCAPECILREAGGEITDLDGNRYKYNREETKNTNGLVVTNGKIHNQVLEKAKHI